MLCHGASLGAKPIGAAVEEGGLAHIAVSGQEHQHAGQAEAETAVRGAPELETLQVVADRPQGESLLLGLGYQLVVPVLALSAGGYLEPPEEEVEAVGGLAVLATHVVEGPDCHGVVRHEDELMPVLLDHVLGQPALPLRVQVTLLASPHLVALALKDLVRLGHGDARERQSGYCHRYVVGLLDPVAELVGNCGQDILQPVFLDLHHVQMALYPADLHVNGGELRIVTGGEAGVGAEDRSDFEHSVEPAGDRHLLVELRALGQVGRPAKVGQAEKFGPALAGATHQLGRVDFQESFLHPVVTHGALHGRLDLEDQANLGTTQVKEAVVHPRIQCGLGGDRDLVDDLTCHLHGFYLDLQAAEFDPGVFHYCTSEPDGGLRHEAGDGRCQIGVTAPVVDGLSDPCVVADDSELHPLLVADCSDPACYGYPLAESFRQVSDRCSWSHLSSLLPGYARVPQQLPLAAIYTKLSLARQI